MIVREYYQNINIYKPRDYFERWYADVWRQRISKPNAPPGMVDRIVEEELARVGAQVKSKDRGYKFVVTFNEDQDYTAFVLRWA